MEGEPLAGGLANPGAVWRRGVAVRRPAPANAPAVHGFLHALRDGGFACAPLPRRISEEGWEELEFINGDVPLPPYPWWSLSDDALASVAGLLRRYHDAAASVPVDRTVAWPTDLADPEGGPLLCHNDVCPENVVFRDRTAVALIDFDFAAPGRPIWDLAMTARYWVPMLDPTSAAVSRRDHLDPLRRLRVVVDAYDLDAGGRAALPAVVEQTTAVARAFVAARVDAGLPAFLQVWDEYGRWERWDRLQQWLADHRAAFIAAIT